MGAAWVSAQRLTEAIGPEAAAILLREKSSKPLYVRRRAPHPDIVELIGAGPAAALSEAFGGSDLLLPTSTIRPEPRKTRVIELLESGASARVAAEVAGVSVRFASEVRRDLGLSRPRKKPKASKEIIMDMIRAGRKDAEIAQACGVTRKSVWCLRLELQREARA